MTTNERTHADGGQWYTGKIPPLIQTKQHIFLCERSYRVLLSLASRGHPARTAFQTQNFISRQNHCLQKRNINTSLSSQTWLISQSRVCRNDKKHGTAEARRIQDQLEATKRTACSDTRSSSVSSKGEKNEQRRQREQHGNPKDTYRGRKNWRISLLPAGGAAWAREGFAF